MKWETVIIMADIVVIGVFTAVLAFVGLRAYHVEILRDFKRKIKSRSQSLLDINVAAMYEIGGDVFYTGPPLIEWKPFTRKSAWSATTIVWNHAQQHVSDVILTFPNVERKAEAVLATVRSIYDFETSRNTAIDKVKIKEEIQQLADNAVARQKIPVIISSELAMLVCIKNNNLEKRKSQ